MKNLCVLFLAFSITTALNAQKREAKEASLREQLIGTWTLVSVDNIAANGSRSYPYGESPQGLLMVDGHGNYAIQILRALRPKVASGDKNKCTPEENAALVQGSNSHFGKISLDETNRTVTFHIEHASFPNWEGTEQKRSYTYSDHLMRYVVTHTTQGGQSVIAEVTWKKLW